MSIFDSIVNAARSTFDKAYSQNIQPFTQNIQKNVRSFVQSPPISLDTRTRQVQLSPQLRANPIARIATDTFNTASNLGYRGGQGLMTGMQAVGREANREVSNLSRNRLRPEVGSGIGQQSIREGINRGFDTVVDKVKNVPYISGDLTNVANNARGVYNFLAGGRPTKQQIDVAGKVSRGKILTPQERTVAGGIGDEYLTNVMLGSTGVESKRNVAKAEASRLLEGTMNQIRNLKMTKQEFVDHIAHYAEKGTELERKNVRRLLANIKNSGKTVSSFYDEAVRAYPGLQQEVAKRVPAFTYSPAKNLSSTQKNIERDFGDYLTKNYNEAKQAYQQQFGRVLNTDNARELSPAYRLDRSQSAAVHEPASEFTKQLFKDYLKEKPITNTSLFTAGGTGAGKTTAIADAGVNLNNYDFVYDGNMNTFDSAKKKIEDTLKSGRSVDIYYIYRDPMEALQNGALPRAERMGRTVPLEAHVDTHIGSLDTMLKLKKLYKNNPKVKIVAVDNSFGKGQSRLVDLDSLTKKRYNKSYVEQNAKKILENEYKAGNISQKTYEGFVGRRSESNRLSNEGLTGARPQENPNYIGNSFEQPQQAGSNGVTPPSVPPGFPERPQPRPSQTLNPERLNLTEEGKNFVASLDQEDPRTVLSNKSVQEAAANVNPRVNPITEEATRQKLAQNVATRQQATTDAAAFMKARAEGATEAELRDLLSKTADSVKVARSVGTDAGRTLQAQKILADERAGAMEKVLALLDNAGVDKEKYLDDATKVDWTNADEVVDFYRKYVPAKFEDWLSALRYNSMLSSPNTHINNAFSNVLGSSFVAPIEKEITGIVDLFSSKLRKKERTAVSGEGIAYAKGYVRSIRSATDRFAKAMKGSGMNMANLDLQGHIPISAGQKGIKKLIAQNLEIPTRLLEASDQFFSALVEGAVKSSLEHRASKGVKVKGNIDLLAQKEAAYRLYREKLRDPRQGVVLDAIDRFTGLIEQARGSDNWLLSTASNFTLPFVKTPMNILKQGLEYSPFGFTTAIGATNVEEQISKAIFGSSVFLAGSMLLGSGRLTWSAPANKKEKDAFYAAGMLPYSIKVGDKWVQYTKLPPQIAFPLALVASMDDAMKNRTLTQSTFDAILSGVSKYGNFFADQSYLKSIGDLLSAVKGDPYSPNQVLANYPQQLVPWRAMGGWLARLTDPYQRYVSPDQSYIDQQVQLLMQNIPGLSQKLPARISSDGTLQENQNRYFNAVSPLRTSTENKDLADIYRQLSGSKTDLIDALDKGDYGQAQSIINTMSSQSAAAQLRSYKKYQIEQKLTPEEKVIYKLSKSAQEQLVKDHPEYKSILDNIQKKENSVSDPPVTTKKKKKTKVKKVKKPKKISFKRGRKSRKLASSIKRPKLAKLKIRSTKYPKLSNITV